MWQLKPSNVLAALTSPSHALSKMTHRRRRGTEADFLGEEGVSGAAHPEELEGSHQTAWTRAGHHCWGRFLLPAGPGAQDPPLPVSLSVLCFVCVEDTPVTTGRRPA